MHFASTVDLCYIARTFINMDVQAAQLKNVLVTLPRLYQGADTRKLDETFQLRKSGASNWMQQNLDYEVEIMTVSTLT